MPRPLVVSICWSLGLLACVARVPQGAAQEAVALHCARGNVAEYPDAQLTLDRQGRRVVHVTFVGYRPSPGRADWSLRDCLRTAVKFDASQDIVAKLWYREPQLRSRQEPLPLHGASAKLMYSASAKKIVLRAQDSPAH
jgi:hypothetical protein